MTEEFNPTSLLDEIELPKQTLTKLSFCNSIKLTKFVEWAGGLKTTQILHTSVVFYKALPELSVLKTSCKNRLNMLEEIRPRVQYCIVGLTKEFLNQPVLLPENAQKAAIIAQAIQKQLLDAYLVALKQCFDKGTLKDTLFAEATLIIHRAMSSIGMIYLRGFQLYTQPPKDLWGTLHKLYQIAYFFDLNKTAINDTTLTTKSASNIDQTYIRILLLAAARTNQLNQADIAHVYRLLEPWAEQVRLIDNVDTKLENLLIVDVSSSAGPQYKGRQEEAFSDEFVEIDTSKVLEILKKQDAGENSGAQTVHAMVSTPLAQHLCSAWGYSTERTDNRRRVNTFADICVGLSDCHRVIAQGQQFKDFTQRNSLSPAVSDNHYGAAFTPNSQFDTPPPEDITSYTGSVINASQRGYCILWKGEMPTKVQAGEILLIKEHRRTQWSLAVIRWIKQLKTASQIGIQVISSQPSPSAMAQIFDMGGESDFMRALAAPSNLNGSTVQTMIVSSSPFVQGSKAKLILGEKTSTIRLEKCIFATSNILQFTYRQIDTAQTESTPKPQNKAAAKPSADSFNDSWDES